MKIKNLPKLFFAVSLVLISNVLTYSQNAPTGLPVNWINYSVKADKATFLMPKPPIVVNESNKCRGEETHAYGAYADGVAYVVRITKKTDVPNYCTDKKTFDETNFQNRIELLKNMPAGLKQSDVANVSEVILTANKQIYKLINDPQKNRWFEFTVVGADENNREAKNFLASLKQEKKITGLEIEDGADRVWGDENDKQQVLQGETNLPQTSATQTTSNTGATEGVRVVLKPRAFYTDLARKTNTQGKVTLRVTFTATGGIGGISVISGLANGLTEQAIVAARKILFVPAQRNGVRYTVTKPVEYSFTIY